MTKEQQQQREREFVEVLMNSKMCPNVQTLTLLCGHEQENVYISTALLLIIIIINTDDNSQHSRHSSSASLIYIYMKLSISFYTANELPSITDKEKEKMRELG